MTLITHHPKELTAEDVHNNIVTLQYAIDTLHLHLGKQLHIFCEGEMWLEKDCRTFEEYLATPEVHVKRTTAFALKRLYKKIVLDLNIPPDGLPGWTLLDVICPHINEENKDALLASASTLTRSDLRRLMSEEYGDENVDLFMEGINDIKIIIYRIEHLASDGQYDMLLKIKLMLKDM